MGLDAETIKKLRTMKKNKATLSMIQKETGISKPTIIKYTKDVMIEKPVPPAPALCPQSPQLLFSNLPPTALTVEPNPEVGTKDDVDDPQKLPEEQVVHPVDWQPVDGLRFELPDTVTVIVPSSGAVQVDTMSFFTMAVGAVYVVIADAVADKDGCPDIKSEL